MKIYLTEADTAISAHATQSKIRQPLKLLQDLQGLHRSVMSSKVAVPSTSQKSATSKQRNVESSPSSKELSHNRNKTSSSSPRQTSSAKNSVNAKSSCKNVTVGLKKQEMPGECKNKTSDSSEGSLNSVGSLTSSPKWSHIKNKFENGESAGKTKLGRSSSLPKEENANPALITSASKSLTSLIPESNLSICKTKCATSKKDVEKKADATISKTTNSVLNSVSKTTGDKSKTSYLNARNQRERIKSRCDSPRTLQANISQSSVFDPQKFSSSKTSHRSGSTIAYAHNSVKTSQTNAPSTTSLSSTSNFVKSFTASTTNTSTTRSSTKNSQSSITSSSSSALNTGNSNTQTTKISSSLKNSPPSSISANVSSLHSSSFLKRNIQPTKTIGAISKQRHEDKPILTFNQQDNFLKNKSDTKLVATKQVKKSLISDVERFPSSNLSNKTKSVVSTPKAQCSASNSTVNRPCSAGIADTFQGTIRNSQPHTKHVWIKDDAGNWVKKGETNVKTISHSKVASLRNKFLESSKETVIPLTKSVTTTNVPGKNILPTCRPLAKSSTTSSICDKLFIDDLTNKDESEPDITIRSDVSGLSSLKSRSTNFTTEKQGESQVSKNDQNSCDNSLKLNAVQRAVLSYEGNLTLLSPETQKRLKLVSEKVRAQTDDDKILKARTKNDVFLNCYRSSSSSSNSSSVKSADSTEKKSEVKNVVGEPVLPVRNFLSRYQLVNKLNHAKDCSKPCSSENKHSQNEVKKNPSARSRFFYDISNSVSNKDGQPSVSDENNQVNNSTVKGKDTSTNDRVTSNARSSMTLDLSADHKSKLPNSELHEILLQPNSSFLWRRSEAASSELSKSSTTSSVSLTSSDYRNYYDIGNYYSSLELEIEKGNEMSEEHIYIDSQDSNNSESIYASSSGTYQNISHQNFKNSFHDDWTDVSDDDYMKKDKSNNQNSTLKKKRNKRFSNHRDSSSSLTRSQINHKQQINDTISFTDSSDTLINDEIENESTFDLSDTSHFYEPVYESLQNYLHTKDDKNDDNCSISLSPDDAENGDFMHCSLTSLESAGSTVQEKEQDCKVTESHPSTNVSLKKSGNKISQLKRHLSWTKNDIRLELSSKFNKIKIKKNGQNSTEIGVKVQEHESANTSPKKKTFIKCILRQKSSGSIPLKRSPSPKKESAHFYVHLSMGREQRPFSDSVVTGVASSSAEQTSLQNLRKQSEPSLPSTAVTKCTQQRPRGRKFGSGPTIQRPKTPPPLPPVQTDPGKNCSESKSSEKTASFISCNADEPTYEFADSMDLPFYSVLDPELVSKDIAKFGSRFESDSLKQIPHQEKIGAVNSSSVEDLLHGSAKTNSNIDQTPAKHSVDLNLPFLHKYHAEHLKSPFEEEPMYQFYHKDVQQRATLWYSADGSESEFEDDASSKLSDPEWHAPAKPPVLQSQLSAMDLVHGEAGQRSLWCEVPEVMQSGILKGISSIERKIQEAMFEVITSEASYLKSLNFLIEHFVQCPEFSGNYAEKHVLDKRERHVLFSDIQPVRDVSASLLADLEKRWLENIVLSNVCDIIYHHASQSFSVYVKYCKNQLYQERTLKELKEKRPDFVAVLKRLESNPVCQGLDMHSFLMLPMQRITRLPLLIDAIFHRLSVDSLIYESCKMALAMVNKLVAECNEEARKMERMEEMLVISQQIDFRDCMGSGLLKASRLLVKRGELVQLLLDNSSRRTFGRSSRWCKIQLYLFLFTDLLIVTRKKSDDSYAVVDYCPRNMLQVMSVDENMPPLPMRLPSSYRNLFQLIMLNNKDGKTVEMLLSCLLESDRTRWMNAVTPAKSENPDEKIYEEWDCPQVQCTHAYNAQQPDELSLEEADVVNVFKKMSDGWFEGERIRDGVRGWFPSSHAVEIINSHVRARNLHQRYRLLMLSQTYLEEQYKAQQTKK